MTIPTHKGVERLQAELAQTKQDLALALSDASIKHKYRADVLEKRCAEYQAEREELISGPDGMNSLRHRVTLYLAMIKNLEALAQGYEKALGEIASHAGMTNFANCCVDKTCTPHFDDGKKVAHCTFQFGVLRGFDTCAGEAGEALQKGGGQQG